MFAFKVILKQPVQKGRMNNLRMLEIKMMEDVEISLEDYGVFAAGRKLMMLKTKMYINPDG